ncbi:MAG: phosphoglycerate dehydrogenase [Planctomycetes bacterium]|nr:phosphoglycerate dehydrogenase [Planctomycetota bacterium]
MTKTLSFPKEKIHVLLLEGIHSTAAGRFAKAGYANVERLSTSLQGEALHEAIAKAHVIGVRSRTHLTEEVLSHARRLFAIGCFCIGTNQVNLKAAADLGIPVFNAPHSNTRSVAELVLAETVMLYRGLGDKNTAGHQGTWTKSAKGSHEVRGKTIGIVGYGHIGSQVSILAEAFGMRVLYHDVEPKLPMGNAHQVDSLAELLPEADVLTLHVPADPSTAGMVTGEVLAAMKPGSYLINASRGSVVDIEALAAALDRGQIGGAAVDVFPVEPKNNQEPFESALRGLPNVILTPHIGGSTLEAQQNIGLEVAHKLIEYSDQGATLGAVNFPALSLARPAEKAHRLLHVHHNRPGVLGQLNRVLADAEANILAQHLQTTPELGYVVLDVDRDYPADLAKRLAQVEGTIRSRILF